MVLIPSKHNNSVRKLISTLVWLQISVSSKPSSDQYFPVEGTIGVHYTFWDPIMFTGCA